MSKNVFSIIYVLVLGKFKRKFFNKIRRLAYIHEPTNLNKNNIYYDSSEISSEDSSDEELNTHIGNTNWCICGNCSKMETSAESLCCCEMIEISDEIFNAIYSYVYSFLS